MARNHCEWLGAPRDFDSDAPASQVLAGLVKCISFGKFEGKFDTRIKGYGLDLLVSQG